MILIPFVSGIFIVFTMSLNSMIGRKTSLLEGVFINYLFGLTTIITISLFTETSYGTSPIFSYFGGLIGVTVIFLSNYFMPKIPVIYSVFLGFIGQILTGIFIDTIFMKDGFNINKLLGAFIVFIALFYLFIIERNEKQIVTKNHLDKDKK
jgi:transporter family-2 protein